MRDPEYDALLKLPGPVAKCVGEDAERFEFVGESPDTEGGIVGCCRASSLSVIVEAIGAELSKLVEFTATVDV
jgi:hypothetical protein